MARKGKKKLAKATPDESSSPEWETEQAAQAEPEPPVEATPPSSPGLLARLAQWWQRRSKPSDGESAPPGGVEVFTEAPPPAERVGAEALPLAPEALPPHAAAELLLLQSELTSLREELDEARRRYREEMAAAEAWINKLQDELDRGRMRAEAAEAKLQEQEAGAQALAAELTLQKQRSDALQAELEQLAQQLASKEQEFAAVRSRPEGELAQARAEISRAFAQVRDLERELANARKHNHELEAQLATQKAHRERRRAEQAPAAAAVGASPSQAERPRPRTTPGSPDRSGQRLSTRRRGQPEEGSTDAKERRKSSRLMARALVQAELSGNQFPLGNLSSTGAFIRARQPLVVGTELQLLLVSVSLPEPIQLTAVVCRSERGRGMGVQFVRVPLQSQRRLEQLLARLSVTRILVVDDDENIRRVLALTLKKENYEVLTASDGVEGLQVALTAQPDLIVLDLHMPGLSGLEVCQQVRASPQLAHVPVLILSATTDVAEYRSTQELGAVMFVPKPFQAQKLVKQIQMLLSR